MEQITRELCVSGLNLRHADTASFRSPETKPWLDKYYTVNDDWVAEDRRKLLAFARDMLNSDYAGHRLTFQLFAQAPPFAHLAAVHRSFDWDGPLSFVKDAANLSDNVMDEKQMVTGDTAVNKWFANDVPRTDFDRKTP